MGVDTSRPKAAVVQPCRDLDETVAFFRDRLGFRLETVFPADDPTVALISGHGLWLRLERGSNVSPTTLRLPRSATNPADARSGALLAPNGTRVILVESDVPKDLGPTTPELVIHRFGANAWNEGRAGMRYRDLIPGRWNGHFIASHIQIPKGGPVPDYVHYHDVRFQMIYCHRGWVRVVYQDQGAPFVMHPGDCVLQPPGIRHQVLEASDGLEVIEIGCPATHATHVDHDLSLPSTRKPVDKIFGGQRFIRHVSEQASWEPSHPVGFEARDLGINAATNGLAAAKMVRAPPTSNAGVLRHPGGFQFVFILAGAVTLALADKGDHRMGAGDAATIPPGMDAGIVIHSEGTEILEVTVSETVFSH
jgi:quercetin dioxygenase-like cupin family protein